MSHFIYESVTDATLQENLNGCTRKIILVTRVVKVTCMPRYAFPALIALLLVLKGSGSHLQSQNVKLDKIMVCRSKYHVETLLKNYQLETNFRLIYYE